MFSIFFFQHRCIFFYDFVTLSTVSSHKSFVVLEPISLTELVVILINIMYQHPGPLPSDTLQTGGFRALTHALTHVNHVVDFGPPPRFLISLNKQVRCLELRKYLLPPAVILMCDTALLRSIVIWMHPEGVINLVIDSIVLRGSFPSLLRQTTPDSGAFSAHYFMNVLPAD